MEPFNPFHHWLGLPPNLRAPNHYQLLQIAPSECSRDVIVAAAKAQLKKLKSVQIAVSQKPHLREIAQQIETAANCLASQKSRERYNQQLLDRLAAPVVQTADLQPFAAAGPSQPADGDQAIPVAIPVTDAEVPMAVPLVDSTLDPQSPIDVEHTADNRIVAAADPPAEPQIVAVESAGLHRRKRQSVPFMAYVGIAVALTMLVAAVAMIVNPSLLERFVSRDAAIAQRGGDSAIEPSDSASESLGVSVSPTDNSDVTHSPDSPRVNPPADHSPVSPLDRALATDSNASADSVAPENPLVPAADADSTANTVYEVSPRVAWSDEMIDTLLSAALYSMAVGNDEVAIELCSWLDPHVSDPAMADRIERFMYIADAHHYLSNLVRHAADIVSGGENLQLEDDRMVGIVEASPDLVVYKALGKNRRFPYELLPAEVQLALVRRVGAQPLEMVKLSAVEFVLHEVHRLQMGATAELDSLQMRSAEQRREHPQLDDLLLIDEFVRLDLPALIRTRETPVSSPDDQLNSSQWLEPFANVAANEKPYRVLAAAVVESDPQGQALMAGYALDLHYAAGDCRLGIAVGYAIGLNAANNLVVERLGNLDITRLTPVQAKQLLRDLLARMAGSTQSPTDGLRQVCVEIIAQFELRNYQHVLDQLVETD